MPPSTRRCGDHKQGAQPSRGEGSPPAGWHLLARQTLSAYQLGARAILQRGSPLFAPCSTSAEADFLGGGGEAADLIRAFDWAATSLGPIDRWRQSLKSAVGLLVHSPVPIVMLWGEDGYMIYNDAYSVFAGGRHPELLGKKVREGWPEVTDFNDHVMKVGLAGGTLSYRNQELTLYR